MAIKHCQTYNRWKTIYNFFIDKSPGNPLSSKLRVIHIYEADWNLTSKYFVAHKLHSKACKQKTVRTEQSRGRPGKSAAHSATNATITNEIIRLQKLTGATLYNNATACFDRIVENISNATLMREGLDSKIAKLHDQTLTNAKYYIKTKNGICTSPNGYGLPKPFYGTGQGAGDSMSRWGLLSNLFIRLCKYQEKSHSIFSSITKQKIMSLISAYVDDSYSIMIANSIDQAKQYLKLNAERWENLLYTIGGKLELSKCKFFVYNWKQDSIGTLTLFHERQIRNIKIKDSETLKNIEYKKSKSMKLTKSLVYTKPVLGQRKATK
jgi:hypothetical protein